MIWNPWKRARDAELDAKQWASEAVDAYHEIDRLRNVLENIAMAAGQRSTAIVRRLSNMAQEALDQ